VFQGGGARSAGDSGVVVVVLKILLSLIDLSLLVINNAVAMVVGECQ